MLCMHHINIIVSDATGAPAASSESGDIMLPTIGAGIAVIFIFVVLTLFAIIIFVIWWNKQKREIKQLPSAINVEALQVNKCVVTIYVAILTLYVVHRLITILKSIRLKWLWPQHLLH